MLLPSYCSSVFERKMGNMNSEYCVSSMKTKNIFFFLYIYNFPYVSFWIEVMKQSKK